MELPKLKKQNSESKLSSLFKETRVQLGYPLEYVAVHAAIEPVSQLYFFEQGESELPLDRIYALANVLEISPSLVLSLIFKA